MAKPNATRINDNVVRCGSSTINWYLVADDDGVTVVDAGLPGYRSQLEGGLRELGRSLADVKAIVLTHAHGDHVGFAEQLRTELSIPVYVHRDDERQAATAKATGSNEGSMSPYYRRPAFYKLMLEGLRNSGAKQHPIGELQTFVDETELPVPGKLRPIHTPGHTPGHCVFVAHGVLLAGDAICTLNPFSGERGPQLLPKAVTRSTAQATASLDRLAGTGAEVLLPGHGEPARDIESAIAQAKAHPTK